MLISQGRILAPTLCPWNPITRLDHNSFNYWPGQKGCRMNQTSEIVFGGINQWATACKGHWSGIPALKQSLGPAQHCWELTTGDGEIFSLPGLGWLSYSAFHTVPKVASYLNTISEQFVISAKCGLFPKFNFTSHMMLHRRALEALGYPPKQLEARKRHIPL